jgi:hypothetical protein
VLGSKGRVRTPWWIAAGDPARLAACCETAGGVLLRLGKDDDAVKYLAEACKQYKAAQQPHKSVAILESSSEAMLVRVGGTARFWP